MRSVLLRLLRSEQHRPRDGRAVKAFWSVTTYENVAQQPTAVAVVRAPLTAIVLVTERRVS